ncbi:MAG: tetratricopeptide repeat-containing sensor histidine kinase [Ignavibacteriaceae bacterium]|jgi:signal transduction histidine kinase
MKKILFFLFFALSVFGQPQLDSLLKHTKDLNDTERIKVINEYCLNIRGNDPALALKLAIYTRDLAKKISNSHFESESENLIGIVQKHLGDYNQALLHHLRALKIAEDTKDSVQLGYSYTDIGVIYLKRYNLNLATENVIHALRVFEAINHLDGMAFTNLTMGTIFIIQKNYEKALTYYRTALNIRELQHNENERARTLNNIAEAYFLMGNYDEALQSYLNLEKICRVNNDVRGLGDCWVGIGRIYSVKNNSTKAIDYFTKALKNFRELDYKEEIIIAGQNLGLAYTKINNPAIGYSFIKDALDLSRKINSPKLISESLRFTAEFYELTNRFDSALVYLKQHHALKDSINEAENFSKLASIETLYQFEKTERENRILLQDVEGQKKQMYFLVIITLLIFVLAFVFVIKNKKLKTINTELKELHAMKDTFFRIIAHDLRAPFNTVFGLTDALLEDYQSLSENEKHQFIEHIASASKQSYQLLENLLLWARTNTGRMEFNPKDYQLKALVNETIELLGPTAQNKNIQLLATIPESMHIAADAEMLKTVLRNLVSNSIKFSNEKEGIVKITAAQVDNKIHVEISDNGIGMPEKVQQNLFRIDKTSSTAGTKGEKGTGIGLLLCKEFVDKHGGTISVESKLNEGTTFIISFPIN